MKSPKKFITELFKLAGITINGANAFDIKVLDEKFYREVLLKGTIGLAETYYKEYWTSKDLNGFFYRILVSNAEARFAENYSMKLEIIKEKFNKTSTPVNPKTEKSLKDRNLLEQIFGTGLNTSSGYWQEVYSPIRAQEQKFKLMCQKLKLVPGDRVLDLSGGWGGFSYYMAKEYNVQVITLSSGEEQQAYIEKLCKDYDVKVTGADFSQLEGNFDKIVSWDLFDNPLTQNLSLFQRNLYDKLRDGGICLLNMLTTSYPDINPWFNHLIFPKVLEPVTFPRNRIQIHSLTLEDLQNFGWQYDNTVVNWQLNLLNSSAEFKDGFPKETILIWNYYLACLAASLRSRRLDVWEVVLTREDYPYLYDSVRFYQN